MDGCVGVLGSVWKDKHENVNSSYLFVVEFWVI